MATSILFSVLLNVIMSTASPTPELTQDSTSPTERFHLTSKHFPSTPPAYSETYYINCSVPECYLQFHFTDLDLFRGSQIKIRDEGAQLILFHFIQNWTYVSERPLFSSKTSSVSINVNMTSPRDYAYTGFKADFESKVKKGQTGDCRCQEKLNNGIGYLLCGACTKTWEAANTYCDDQYQGQLALITDPSVQEVVQGHLEENRASDVWIGARGIVNNWHWLQNSETIAYQGCFQDDPTNRDLNFDIRLALVTPDNCIEQCKQNGYKFAGLQAGTLCFCGNTFGKHGYSTIDCSYPCNGDFNLNCGGGLSNDVYSIDGSWSSGWLFGYPSSGSGGIDDKECMVYKCGTYFGWSWQNKRCERKFRYLCMFDYDNSTCIAHGLMPTAETCISYPDSEPVSWFNANMACAELGGRLLELRSALSHWAIRDALNNQCSLDTLWLGGTKVNWQWANGSPLKYTKWARLRPTNGGDKCVAMSFKLSRSYEWSDLDCNQTLNFVCERPPYHYPSVVPWERRSSVTGCPEFRESVYGELTMSTATLDLQCILVIKGFPGCNLYLKVIDMTDGYVAEVIKGNNSEAKGSLVRLDHVHQFVWSTDGLYVRFSEGIGPFPKRLTFAYGCYGPSVLIQPSNRCVIASYHRFVGLKCNNRLCLLTNGSYCDGIYHCPDREDEDPVRCRPVRTTDWPRTTKRPTPTLRYLHRITTRATYIQSEPTEHATAHSPLIYIVYALVPLIILIMIGCIFYRMTLSARDVFGRRLVYPRNNYFHGYEEAQPPPDYDVALTHPKPAVDPTSALPSYDESNADHAPAYEDIFPHLPPGPGPQPPPGGPPPTIQMSNTPVTPSSFNSTVSTSENMPRLLTRYSQVDISPPAMPTSQECNSASSDEAPGTQRSQAGQQQLDGMLRLDSEENRRPELEQRDEPSGVESGAVIQPDHGIVETSRL